MTDYEQKELESIDKIESFIEELYNNGFYAEHLKHSTIRIATLGGIIDMRYMFEESLMYNYYRAINHIGLKMAKWGLENKLKNSRKL